MINRSTTRDIPHFPVALYEVAVLFGTVVAKTILASVHVRAHKQAGHMDASDLIKTLQYTLQGGGRPHMENHGFSAAMECGVLVVKIHCYVCGPVISIKTRTVALVVPWPSPG